MISGSLVALVTPMTHDGAVDEAALRKLCEWHVASGTNAIVAVGTTGESATLDVEEHCGVVRMVIDQVAGRIPVIAGTGANSTSEAIELTEMAKALGADACLLVTPYYNKPTQEGLYRHYRAVAEAVQIPQILYNVPGRTGVDMQPETVARLAGIPNIMGIKEATGNLDRARWLIQNVGDRMALYSGDDATAIECILLGGKGNISVTANVMPAAMADACRLALAGDREGALHIDAAMRELHQVLFVESNPIPVKWALHEMALIDDGIRLPLTVLAEGCRPVLRTAMQTAGLSVRG